MFQVKKVPVHLEKFFVKKEVTRTVSGPQLYVWHTLLWLREVRRVLRNDGVCWVVLGDSFAQARGHGHWESRQGKGDEHGQKVTQRWAHQGAEDIGYAQGCLLGIPAQIMLAAAADGWVCRNDVTWSKSNPMPESISGWRWQQARCRCVSHQRGTEAQRNGTYPEKPQSDHDPANRKAFAPAQPDPACPQCGGSGMLDEEVLRKGSWRHTRSHETVLMLTKSMGYWANGETVREEAQPETRGRYAYPFPPYHDGNSDPKGGGFRGKGGVDRQHSPAGRNPRSVVTPKSANLDLAHYASFPPDLLIPLVKATCPERVCPVCGQGWAPSIERTSILPMDYTGKYRETDPQSAGRRLLANLHARRLAGEHHDHPFPAPRVHGLRPTCAHYCTCVTPAAPAPCPQCGKLPLSAWQPGSVLDCFAGSGTTALVARALRRRAVCIDVSYHYLQTIARERLGLTALAQWEGQPKPRVEESFGDLPLFTPTPERGMAL